MTLALTIQKIISLLLAQLKYKLFNIESIIVMNLGLKEDIYVEHPVNGFLNMTYFLNSLHKDLKEDAIYPLISYDGVQYKMLDAIKNLEDQEIFTEKFFLDNFNSIPKYLIALHPFKRTFFHKHIIVVGN